MKTNSKSTEVKSNPPRKSRRESDCRKEVILIRLWHYELIPFLPKSQLLAQWRELNSIFKKQDKHILINYVYEYQKADLFLYAAYVSDEMEKRNIKIKSFDNLINYFDGFDMGLAMAMGEDANPFPDHHTNRYLLQCFYNLQEKYDRGQKGFSEEEYLRLERFVVQKGLI